MNERTNGGNVIGCYNYITRFLIDSEKKKLKADEILTSMQWFYELNFYILERIGKRNEMLIICLGIVLTRRNWKRIMIVYRLQGDLLARRGGLVPKKKKPKNEWKLGNNETHWCVWLKTAGTRWNGSAWRVEVEEGTWRAITVPVMPLRNCIFLRAYRAIFRESPANAFHLNKCLGLTTLPPVV